MVTKQAIEKTLNRIHKDLSLLREQTEREDDIELTAHIIKTEIEVLKAVRRVRIKCEIPV